MTRYFEILIEKESIPVDLTLAEIKLVPHYEISAREYEQKFIEIDIELQNHFEQSKYDDFNYLAYKIIKRYYKKVIKITELEEIKHLEDGTR